MQPTRYYKLIAFGLLCVVILLTQFTNAVLAGDIAFPREYGWLVGAGILIAFAMIALLKDEVQHLSPEVAALLADATSRGTVAGISAAGGLPQSMLTPRDDVPTVSVPTAIIPANIVPRPTVTSSTGNVSETRTLRMDQPPATDAADLGG